MTSSTTQTQPHARPTTTQLLPYVFFYGRCEEALEFYKKIFGGTYEIQRNSQAPEDCGTSIAPEFKNKVMHANFTAPGIAFLASDGREAKTINPDDGNISLALSLPDAREGERVFKALAEGGTVKVPLAEAFWGGKFGLIHDRFGTEWLITTP